jgi:aryl-alcohol dehydrogenase-like predicted oxidoreductase
LASLNRGPLAMGLLTGKFNADSTLPANDVRAGNGWDFRSGEQARRLTALEEMRAVLTRDGRTLAQAAIAWLWAHSNATIPIPGFKNVAQVEENAGALAYAPLSNGQMAELATLKSG